MTGCDGELTITVIVPVHNGGEAFRHCLSGVLACDPAPTEIIVVDDGSVDDSAEIAAAAGVRVLSLPSRHGPAYARNRGVEMASSSVVLFVDADVVLRPDAVAQVRDAFAREPHIAAVFGSYDDSPAATNFLSQYKNLMHHYVHQTGRLEASTFWTGCGAIRRDVLLAHGGFDETYQRPAIEDVELGYRLRRSGHVIRLRKSLQAKHLKRWDVTSLLTSDIRDRALPWTTLLRRQGALVNDLNLGWASRVSVIATYGLVAAIAAGLWQPYCWIVAAMFAAALVVLNAGLYAFCARRRGMVFAIGCIAWHWLYFLYGGATFAFVALRSLGLARTPSAEVLARSP